MREILTLYNSYDECRLDLSIFGQLVSTPTQSVSELKDSLYKEFQKRKPFPSLESRRYELGNLAETVESVNYAEELDLQDDEELFDLRGGIPRPPKPASVGDEPLDTPCQDVKDFFAYQLRVTDAIRDDAVSKYDMVTGEDLPDEFKLGVATAESIVGSGALTDDTVLSDEQIDDLGADANNFDDSLGEDEVSGYTGFEELQDPDDLVSDDEIEDFDDGWDEDSEEPGDAASEDADSLVSDEEFEDFDDDWDEGTEDVWDTGGADSEDTEDFDEDDSGDFEDDSESISGGFENDSEDVSEDSEDGEVFEDAFEEDSFEDTDFGKDTDFGDDDFGEEVDFEEDSDESRDLDVASEDSEGDVDAVEDAGGYFEPDDSEGSDYEDSDDGDWFESDDSDDTAFEDTNWDDSDEDLTEVPSDYEDSEQTAELPDDSGEAQDEGYSEDGDYFEEPDDENWDEDVWSDPEDQNEGSWEDQEPGDWEDVVEVEASDDEEDVETVTDDNLCEQQGVLQPQDIVSADEPQYNIDIAPPADEDFFIPSEEPTVKHTPPTQVQPMRSESPAAQPPPPQESEPTDLRQFLRKHPNSDINYVMQYFTKKQIEQAIKLGKIAKRGNKLRLA